MAVRADRFFEQLPTYRRNQSAEQFDLLAAGLGFTPNDSRGLNIRLNPEAALAYRNIETSLKQFLRSQAIKTSGPLEAPPPELRAYLKAHADLIEAVQVHLLAQPVPQWDMTLEHMFAPNYPFPGFFNVRNFQEVLLLTALDHNHRGQHAEMVAALEASWQLNQALLQRPDLTAQVSLSAVSELQSGLLRHLDNVPKLWRTRLIEQAQRQSVTGGQQFEAWLQYKVQQQLLMSAVSSQEDRVSWKSALSSRVSYWLSPVYIIQLKALKTTQRTHQALEQLQRLEVCSTTQNAAEQRLGSELTGRQRMVSNAEVLARRWKIEGDRTLSLELTQQVLHAKAHYGETGQWPQPSTEVRSAACSKEIWSWAYEHAPTALQGSDDEGGVLTLSLSAQPLPTSYHPPLYPGPPVPLSYQVPLN